MEPWIRESVVQQVPTSLRRSAASLQSAVGVATELRAGRSGDRMPVEARNLFLLRNVQTACGVDPAFCSLGFVFFLWVKRPHCEIKRSPLSSAEVKNEWSCTSAPPIRWSGPGNGRLYLYILQLPDGSIWTLFSAVMPDSRGWSFCDSQQIVLLSIDFIFLACNNGTEQVGSNRNVADWYTGVFWFVCPSETVLSKLRLLPVPFPVAARSKA